MEKSFIIRKLIQERQDKHHFKELLQNLEKDPIKNEIRIEIIKQKIKNKEKMIEFFQKRLKKENKKNG